MQRKFKRKKLQVKPFKSEFDKLGSYTGVPSDGEKYEVPTQDADDL